MSVLLLLLVEEEEEDNDARGEEGGGDGGNNGVGGMDIVGDAVTLLERDPPLSLQSVCQGGDGGTTEF